MGMLFLVLTPALYCDVTDSWLLPNKWKRIWISAAGIYVECFLASLATFVWWNTEEGLLKSLMMATMFICSVNTIMFNANPLLRYDGYYVMADWLEIPNLRIKSTQFFTYLFQEKVLGLEIPVQSYMPRSRRSLFVTYAIASYLYRWVVTFSILFFLYKFLQPYKLGSISAIMAVGSMVPLVGMPVYQMIKFVRTPGRMRKVKKVRAASFAAVAVVTVAGILLIPTPLRVQGTLVLKATKPQEVYAEVPGRLVEPVRPRRRGRQEGDRDRDPVEPPEAPRPDQPPGAARRQLRQGPLVRPEPRPGEPRPGPPARADGPRPRTGDRTRLPGDRRPDPGRRPRRPGHGRPAPRDGRPVGQAGQAVLRGRRPAPARSPHDPRPGRHRPRQGQPDAPG